MNRRSQLSTAVRTPSRKLAWFRDQYKHPQESKHSYDEVLKDWFEPNGIEFLSSIPKIGPAPFLPDEQLFAQHPAGSKLSRVLTQIDMLMGGGVDGALFIMIGRKKASIAQFSDKAPAFGKRDSALPSMAPNA